MGLVTSVLWLFYFVIGITWPSYVKRFSSGGAFMWYCAWCIIGLVLIYLCVAPSPLGSWHVRPSLILHPKSFVPETKGKELEDLDETFSIPTQDFAVYHKDRAVYAVRRYVFRQNQLTPPPPPTPRPTELAPMASFKE